jgi:hypothetical protein
MAQKNAADQPDVKLAGEVAAALAGEETEDREEPALTPEERDAVVEKRKAQALRAAVIRRGASAVLAVAAHDDVRRGIYAAKYHELVDTLATAAGVPRWRAMGAGDCALALGWALWLAAEATALNEGCAKDLERVDALASDLGVAFHQDARTFVTGARQRLTEEVARERTARAVVATSRFTIPLAAKAVKGKETKERKGGERRDRGAVARERAELEALASAELRALGLLL